MVSELHYLIIGFHSELETLMTARIRQLAIGVLVLGLSVGCTDKRTPPPQFPISINNQDGEILVATAEVQFNGKTTNAYQMKVQTGSLYLTGTTMGFSRWDIGTAPYSPSLTFAQHDNIISFSPAPPFGQWTPQSYGSGAVEINYPYAYVSGGLGTSVIDLSQTTNPVEVERYPRPVGNSAPGADVAFIYKGFAKHPTQPGVIYGFREQDYIYTLAASGASLSIAKKDAYTQSGATVCCVRGATTFGDKIFIAFRNALWVLGVNGTALTQPLILSQIHAQAITSTATLLYVYHEPVAQSGSTLTAGIYVFDRSGNQVAFLPIRPRSFTVSEDDGYLYANMDGEAVKIFEIKWSQQF